MTESPGRDGAGGFGRRGFLGGMIAAAGAVVGGYRVLSGSNQNCAGGHTPWYTWLSCEESGAGGRVHECDPLRAGNDDPVPTDWLLEQVDATPALQGAGGVGVQGYLSSSSSGSAELIVDDLLVTDA